jgi:hypothetical protein
MWPFKNKNLSPTRIDLENWMKELRQIPAAPSSVRIDLPENWREKLGACNFQLAKRELQTFFDFATRQVERQGEQVVYRVEFVRGWQVFAERPCFETAVAFIDGAPDYADLIWAYFVDCCPGGRWAFYDSQLSHLKQDEST